MAETPSTLSKEELIAEAEQAERQIKDSLPEDPKASDVFEALGFAKITPEELNGGVKEVLQADAYKAKENTITPYRHIYGNEVAVDDSVEIYKSADGATHYFIRPDEAGGNIKFTQFAESRFSPKHPLNAFLRRDFMDGIPVEDMAHELAFYEKAVAQAPDEFKPPHCRPANRVEPMSLRTEIEEAPKRRKKIFGIF